MRKVAHIVAGLTIMVAAPVAMSMTALAAFECEIGFTGPDSQNMCVSEQEYQCEIINDTQVTINNVNDQDAVTGDAEINDNRTGGSATTGSAGNSNQSTFTLRIENGGTDDEVCFASLVVPANETPETPETPEPGRGEATVQPEQKVTPNALPVTSSGSAPILVVVGGSALTVGLAVAHRRLRL